MYSREKPQLAQTLVPLHASQKIEGMSRLSQEMENMAQTLSYDSVHRMDLLVSHELGLALPVVFRCLEPV
jgi:hypothetical protein